MIAEARKKNIYDELQVIDITEFLNSKTKAFDLIIASDVFIYIGDLEPVFKAVKQAAKPNAFFLFSTEACEQYSYFLQFNGRYAHSQRYIQTLAEEHQLTLKLSKSIKIRKEYYEWVRGDIFILQVEA